MSDFDGIARNAAVEEALDAIACAVVDRHGRRLREARPHPGRFNLSLAPTLAQIKAGKDGIGGYRPQDDRSVAIFKHAVAHLEQSAEAKGILNATGAIEKIHVTLKTCEWAYDRLGRPVPGDRRQEELGMLENALERLSPDGWCHTWVAQELETLQGKANSVPSEQHTRNLKALLAILLAYDDAEKPVWPRVLSVRAYGDSKEFERDRLAGFLKAAESVGAVKGSKDIPACYAELGLKQLPKSRDIGGWGQLVLDTGRAIDLSLLGASGTRISEAQIARIRSVRDIACVIVIENRTNFEALCEAAFEGLFCVYGNGQNIDSAFWALMDKLQELLPASAPILIWSDIDAGGFQIATRIRNNVARATPFLMSASDLAAFPDSVLLRREQSYWANMKKMRDSERYAPFHDEMEACISRNGTLEQEVMLDGYFEEHIKNVLDGLKGRAARAPAVFQHVTR